MMSRTIFSALGAVIWLAAFFYVLHRRWLSQLKGGFFITLLIALTGTGVVAAWMVGVWGYESAEQILQDQIVRELGNVDRIVETQVGNDIAEAISQLNALASVLAPEMNRQPSKETETRFRQMQRVSPRFVQHSLLDKNGRALVVVSSTNTSEAVNRVGTAFSLEGKAFATDPYLSTVFDKYILYLGVPVASPQGEIIGVLSARFNFEAGLSSLMSSTRFGESGYAVLVSNDGRILAHPNPERLRDDISGYRAVQEAVQGRRGYLFDKNKAGQDRLFIYQSVDGPGTVNPKPMALLTEMSREEAAQPLRELRNKFLFGAGIVVLACMLIAQQLSHYIKRPFHDLNETVARIQQGDLTAHTQIGGRDEVGQLSSALNQMVQGLQERDKVKELFGRYVTTQVSEEVLKGQVNLGGESRRVTILFSDIRDFTTMAEGMAPSQVVSFLNDYFSEMVEAVFEHGGVLDKFIGDGMMAVFGSLGDFKDHPRRAVMAALRMKALLGKINGERAVAGKPQIQIGIGVHTDDVVVGNIGSRRRLEYTVIGDGVNTSSRVQSLNKELGTTILITETTYADVKDYFECRLMPEAHLKGKAKMLQFYEVLSLKAA